MTTSELAKFLFENSEDSADYPAKIFVDRLVLRLFNSTSLMSYLRDIAYYKESNGYRFQLKFSKLPSEVVHQVKQLIGVSGVRAVEFKEKHIACTGFDFVLDRQALQSS